MAFPYKGWNIDLISPGHWNRSKTKETNFKVNFISLQPPSSLPPAHPTEVPTTDLLAATLELTAWVWRSICVLFLHKFIFLHLKSVKASRSGHFLGCHCLMKTPRKFSRNAVTLLLTLGFIRIPDPDEEPALPRGRVFLLQLQTPGLKYDASQAVSDYTTTYFWVPQGRGFRPNACQIPSPHSCSEILG